LKFGRHIVFILCIVATIASLIGMAWSPWWATGALLFGTLVAIGVRDMIQTRHSILRNYPVIGHVRWMIEAISPELRQYLFEDGRHQAPFTRDQRNLVFRRAKGDLSEEPFGTRDDVYADGYEFIGHSNQPAATPDHRTFRIDIGGPDCAQPYSASIFNISAMSFGSLSANAILALNKGARDGGFAHDTGEGSISPHHRVHGGDLIWEIGSGYFGCRRDDGSFDPDRFAQQAADPQVRMVTTEIALTRGVPLGVDCVSPSSHRAFSDPIGMMRFLGELRRLSGGKPVGFKLCIGQPWEFMAMVKAMLETGIVPDFIVVDGAEGGTGAAPVEFANHMGMPLREGLLFVHNVLVGTGLRDRVKVGAAGKITSAFDIAAIMALGADWVNAGRGFMFALGCIQSLSCNTNRCPTGIATQDPSRQRALVVPDKAERVAGFHRRTLHGLAEMIAAAGIDHPSKIKAQHLVRRVSRTEIRLFSDLHVFLREGALLDEVHDHDFYEDAWRIARADRFGLGA
jgi:glutamate synthase domain-containing protein 2